MNSSLLGGLWEGNPLERGWTLRREFSVWRGAVRVALGSGPPWRIPEVPNCMARLSPAAGWLGCRSVLVRNHVSVGVWSAGLGIINPGRRWSWEWAGLPPCPL